MLRITKQADYGIVLLTHFARAERGTTITASQLTERTGLPGPTVTKVLKLLGRAGLLISHRGVQGGYELSRAPDRINVAQIIAALEGPIAFTQCSANAVGCTREPICPVRPNWQRVDEVLRQALEGISLTEMADDMRHKLPVVQLDAPLEASLEGEDAEASERELAASGDYR